LVLIAGLQLRRLHGLAAHVGEAVVPTARRSPKTAHVPRRVMSPPSSPRASVSGRHSWPPSVRRAVSASLVIAIPPPREGPGGAPQL